RGVRPLLRARERTRPAHPAQPLGGGGRGAGGVRPDLAAGRALRPLPRLAGVLDLHHHAHARPGPPAAPLLAPRGAERGRADPRGSPADRGGDRGAEGPGEPERRPAARPGARVLRGPHADGDREPSRGAAGYDQNAHPHCPHPSARPAGTGDLMADERLLELLPAEALGALDADERAYVESRLAQDPEARRELLAFEAAAARDGPSRAPGPPAPPPPG